MGFSRITAAPLSRPHMQMGLVKKHVEVLLKLPHHVKRVLDKTNNKQLFLFALHLTGSTLTGVFKHNVQLPFLGMEFKL